jgi:Calx-beta domain
VLPPAASHIARTFLRGRRTSTAALSIALFWYSAEALAQSAPGLAREYVYAGENALAVVGPPPTLSIDDIAVLEGRSGSTRARFTISLNVPAPQAVSVTYTTADGTALAGTDYVAASGTASIAAGGTSTFVDLSVIGDAAVEPREAFLVNLTSPVGASIGKAQGLATIVDDEASFYFPVTPCRLADTRLSFPLAANTSRNFQVTGLCGLPSTARSVALIVTSTAQTGLGNLRVYPAPGPLPTASILNFSANKARAGNGIVALGQDGQVTVRCDMFSGQTHVILDVMGYFQ